MVDSVRYGAFLSDKQGFFNVANSFESTRIRATNKSFSFLTENRLYIEQEFNQMFAALTKNGTHPKEFWRYCDYCCTMLQSYYERYGNTSKAAYYQKLGIKLKHYHDNGKLPKEEVNSLQKKIAADLGSLVSTPMHTSKIRDWLGFINIYRIHFVFCRLSVKKSLLLVRELEWLEQLDKLLGMHLDIDGMVSKINAPTGLFNAFSVGIFAARLIINGGLLLKHTFSESAAESSIGKTERFYQELYARHRVMANDLVWGTVNLFSNYSAFFNISAPVAGWLTAGFMVFDVSLLIWGRHLAEHEYLLKKEQYTGEKSNYRAFLRRSSISSVDYVKHRDMLNDQLIQLEIHWQATNATYWFNVGAAVLLTTGFSASMLLAAPAAIVACYFVCTIAVAMYLTADSYGAYKNKSLVIKLQELSPLEKAKALDDLDDARHDFIIAMTKSIIMPLLVVTTFAVCWQAALILTAMYMGYESTRGYFKNEQPEDDSLPMLTSGVTA